MATWQIAVLALVFVAVAGGSLAAAGLLAPDVMRRRVRQLAQHAGDAPAASPWRERIVSAVTPAGRLSLPEGGWERSALRQRFMHAGFRGPEVPAMFFGAKTLLAIGLPGAYVLVAGIGRLTVSLNAVMMLVLLLAAIGYYAPNFWLNRRIARRQREIFETFPDAIDLMTIAVEAGLGLDAAIARVGDEMGTQSTILGDELKLVGLELRAGAAREDALRNLGLRTGVAEVELFVAMLVQADRFGNSMADSLRIHSDELRAKRRLRAEEAAAKMPLKLLFPLVFCIFPALMIVLLAPAVIGIYRVFVPTAVGG